VENRLTHAQKSSVRERKTKKRSGVKRPVEGERSEEKERRREREEKSQRTREMHT
jgi:hypothetical protein